MALPFSIFVVGFSIFTRCSSLTPNPLNGKHLRVIWPNWSGNRKGLIGPLKGGVFLDFLATYLNFTHEMVRVEQNLVSTVGRDQISYIIENECDLLINSIVPTVQYNKIMDLTTYWLYDYFALVIPVPDETANINAVIKPFQWQIWLGLGVAIVCVIAVLYLIQKYFDQPSKQETDTIELKNEKKTKTKIMSINIYVFGMLLSQGGPCLSKRLQIRLVAGVWCLATFLFVQAYSSVLFTYVVAPVNRPIINSIYDVIYNNDISLFVREGGIDVFIQKNDTTVLLTKLANKLDSISNSRCINISDCVYQVKPGSRNVFMEGSLYAKDQIRTDFKRTGKCNLQFAKEGFFNYYVTIALPKNSPYTQSINQGLLKLQQTGIIDYWDLWFRPMPPQCNGKPLSGNKGPQKKSSLSFKNLTGAFILIGVGLSLSTLVFLCEQIVFMRERYPRRTRNKVTDAETI